VEPPEDDGYGHDALFYPNAEHLEQVAVPFLAEGLERGELAVLVGTEPTTTRLHDALGHHKGVRVLDREPIYQQATLALDAFRTLVRDELAAGATRLRILADVDFGTDPDAWAEWTRFEALCNVGLSEYPVWGVCAYDTSALQPEVLIAGGLTHPHLVAHDERRENPLYEDPTEVLRRHERHLPDPVESTPPQITLHPLDRIGALRGTVRDHLSHLPKQAVDELVLAVNEVASNAIRHGRPPVTVKVWTPPDRIVTTVTDCGAGVDNPVAGYLPAHEDLSKGGMGLWLARQLCDRVDLSRSGGEFTVRLTKHT
jgi:anti-sigma regulatory factor (Ser/Thr protein kinase)